MKVALVRIGIDSGSGRMHGPLFRDGRFELIPIPDTFKVGEHTYGNSPARYAPCFLVYFPRRRRSRLEHQPLHWDPEFVGFTYGNPMQANRGLSELLPGDMLGFYAGLQGWDFQAEPALYLVGRFVVMHAARAIQIPQPELQERYGRNFHVRHTEVFRTQINRLTLVQGGPGSRLLERAVKISATGKDCRNKPIHVLAPELHSIFGELGGINSLRRSTARWADPEHAEAAGEFLRSLR